MIAATASRFACIAVAVLIAACAPMQTPPSGSALPGGVPATRGGSNVNLSGFPPPFKDGFSDGCESLRGNYRRDASRFGKDNDYTLGWHDGYSVCGRQKR